MKILLIYPPVTIYGPGSVSPHPPLGLAYLAAYLEKAGHSVKILDALALGKDTLRIKGKSKKIGLGNQEIKKEIRKYQPQIVGIGVMFTAFIQDAYQVARLVKKINPKIITVFGGAHVSIDPQAVLENKNVDIAVKGEGEITFLKLIKAIEKNKDLSKVTGITYKKGKKIIQTPPTPFIRDLNQLPLPARHLLPMDLYDSPNPFSIRYPAASMVTSRGCPGKCVYCSVQAIWGRTWRSRSAQNVVDEIESLIKNYQIKEIRFQDDSISINKKRLNDICDQIIKRKIDIKWSTPNGIAHWTLDKKLLAKMKQAGCYRITFGIESGNPKIRRWVGKAYSLKQAKELTQYANKIGFWTLATNIIGFPYETKKQINDTVNFAIDSDVDFAFFFRLGPRPGTPVYHTFKKEGWLPKNKKLLFSESVACQTKYLKGKELYQVQNQAYQKFIKKRFLSFLNPLRTIRKINSFEDAKYVAGLLLAGIKMAFNLLKTRHGVTSGVIKV